MIQKGLFFLISVYFISIFSSLFATPSADFSIDPLVSNLIWFDGQLYTKTGALHLSGSVSENVQAIEFSGTTLTGGIVYQSGTTLGQINSLFPSNTSLTGGIYTISAFDSSGTNLGSEELVVDKVAPKVQSITYFDLDKNGKIDQLTIDFDETLTGTLFLPYSTGMTVYTRKGGLLSSGATSNLDFSDHIISADIRGHSLVLGLQEGDMIKNTLAINTNAGSSASDLKFGLYTNATITDIASNVASLSTSKFPNSSTGILNNTQAIEFVDTGYLYGTNFFGALTVQKIDSRNKTGLLSLSGISLTTTSDSFLGDGNSLQLSSGSKLLGNNNSLFLGAESHILSATGVPLFGKEAFSSAFRTLSGDILSSVSTLTESGILYTYNGTLVGSGLNLSVDYVSENETLSLFSGAISGTSYLIPLPYNLSEGGLRATIFKTFEAGESPNFLGISLVFDALTQPSVAFVASISAPGTISDITKTEAKLSGVVFRPNISGNIYYGTGELFSTGLVQNGAYAFSGLTPGNAYFYRLGLIPFIGWSEIFSETGSFTTLPAPIPPPPVSIAFQSTTYLTDQNPLLHEFTCDTTHADCKINFNLESSFGTRYNPSDYFCELNFDLDYESGEEYKCNPNTVTFPRGHDYALHFRIIHTPEVQLFTERTIVVHSPSLSGSTSGTGSTGMGGAIDTNTSSTGGNVVPVESVLSSTVTYGGSSVSYSPSLLISEPIIVVQSGLDSNNRCTKADCTVNFEYKVLNSKEACHWDFPGGSYSSGTENKCNPGYIHYPFGEFLVTLRVFEQGNTSNFHEKILHISNGTQAEILQAKNNPKNHPPIAFIKLQGTLGKTKIQQGNSVQCIGVDTCSINLSGEESYDIDHDSLTYFWNFGNGQTSDKENPAAISFQKGEYAVTLRVTESRGYSSEATFHVSVLGKGVKEITTPKMIDPNVSSLKITSASPNPLGGDGLSEWVEITNPLASTISLASCTLDDTLEKGSSPYAFPDTEIIPANSSKRFYKLQTHINFNNTGDSANLSCGEKLLSTLTWDYSVPEGFVVSARGGPYSGKVRTKVLRVVDGDTILIELYGKQEKVRLIGVDTPETVDPRKAIQYFGQEASRYTKSRLEGKEIELEFDFNPRDKYDRLLAYAWIDGQNFDAELIRLGYARAYLRFPFRYFKEFEKLGKEAEKNKVGLWADAEVKKILDADAKEDKKALTEELKAEDDKILDDLLEVAKDQNIDPTKLDAEILKRLPKLDTQKKSVQAQSIKSVNVSKNIIQLPDIHISLQGALSVNRKLSGNIFTCYTKKTCSVNLTAGKSQKNIVYFWDFGNNHTFYGANPPGNTFGFGTHDILLRMLDSKTFEMKEETFRVMVKKIASTKKQKVANIPIKKEEKPLVIQAKEYKSPPKFTFHGFSLFQTILGIGAILLLFFGGIFFLIFKNKTTLLSYINKE